MKSGYRYKASKTEKGRAMKTITIKDNISGVTICSGLDYFEITEKLQEAFAGAPDDVVQACQECGEAYISGAPTYEYEALLGIEITED